MINKFLIQGHRGARGARPENTLPSFETALDAGVGSIETDVHLTADGVPVLIHNRVLPTDSAVGINQLTAKQVCATVADSNPDPNRFPDQRPEPMPLATAFCGAARHPYGIATLADLYRFVAAYAGEPGRAAGKSDCQRANAATVVIDVELKSVPFLADRGEAASMERAVIDVIRAAGAVSLTWVRSFDHRCVRRLREMELCLTGVVLIEGTAPVDPVGLVRAADAQVYAPDYQFLDKDLVRQCRDAGVLVLPWTVNEADDWTRLTDWGVDGITTDYPDRLASWLAQPPAKAK